MTNFARTSASLVILGCSLLGAGCAQYTPLLESYTHPLPSAHATPVAIPQRTLNTAARSPRQPSPVVRYQTPDPQSAWNNYVPPNPNYPGYPAQGQGQGTSGQPSQYNSPPGVPVSPYGPPPLPQNGFVAPQQAPPNAAGTYPPPNAAGTYPPPNTAGTYPPPSSVPVPNQVQPPGAVWNGSSVVGPQPPPGTTFTGPPTGPPAPGGLGLPTPLTDVIVNVQEAQTGKLMIGAAVNSEAGLTGQIVIDEQNFDFTRVPTSLDDWANGTAFRGAGQGFRLEALPGNEVQRYMVRFTEPYLLGTRVSFNASGSYFKRRFFDWDEERLGGRFGFGYRVTPELSVQASMRLEEIEISNPRVPGVPELDDVVGRQELYGARFGVTQDTRDIPFAPTQGYYLDLSYEQVFGTFDYPRFTADFRRYFLITQRPDTSGRHVLSFSSRVGITGSQTPIYENFFAGGYSTLRGFEFRGASPTVSGVEVGGELSLLSSVEYRFPITADDMLQGVVFCDYGTVEQEIEFKSENYRVALGAGLRVYIPAMGPAPIALDFAIPVARADTDQIQNFSFFVGVNR